MMAKGVKIKRASISLYTTLVSRYLWYMHLHYNRYNNNGTLSSTQKAMVSLTDWTPLDNESVKLPVGSG